MAKMKIVSGYPHGACSFYRSNGVFPKLDIHTLMMADVDWQSLADTDIVMMERPSDRNFYNAAHIIKEFGVKLWIDFDDNFFALPEWNQSKTHYQNPENQGAIIRCLKIADVVTVTTQLLKDIYSKYNDNIHVVPNAFNDYNYKFTKQYSKNKIIMWRGSNTHRGDLYTKHRLNNELCIKIIEENKDLIEDLNNGEIEIDKFIKQILIIGEDAKITGYTRNMWNVSSKYTDWKWHFIGNDIELVTEPIENKKVHKEQHIVNYFSTIKKLNPAIYVVPLAFNTFNECKSNCGWIEATYAGATTVAPDMPEFRKPGILNYKTEQEFQEKIELLMNDETLRNNCYHKSYKYIKENLMLSKVNELRTNIIEDLLK
jgi:hypothetical protein